MITLIPIKQISDAHGSLIVDAFNRFFILNGGEKDGYGAGYGVYGGGSGDGVGYGYGGVPGGSVAPEGWQVK